MKLLCVLLLFVCLPYVASGQGHSPLTLTDANADGANFTIAENYSLGQSSADGDSDSAAVVPAGILVGPTAANATGAKAEDFHGALVSELLGPGFIRTELSGFCKIESSDSVDTQSILDVDVSAQSKSIVVESRNGPKLKQFHLQLGDEDVFTELNPFLDYGIIGCSINVKIPNEEPEILEIYYEYDRFVQGWIEIWDRTPTGRILEFPIQGGSNAEVWFHDDATHVECEVLTNMHATCVEENEHTSIKNYKVSVDFYR